VLLVAALVSVILVVDQLTKGWITPRYGPCGNPTFTPVLGRYAGISYVCNTGTAFSRFQNSAFVWLPVLLAVGVVAWLWARSLLAARPLQQIAFGLIIGGALGNIIDRARFGYVVDFVDLRLSDQLRWYVFNVADSCIVIGVALLAFAFWRAENGGSGGRGRAGPPPRKGNNTVGETPPSLHRKSCRVVHLAIRNLFATRASPRQYPEVVLSVRDVAMDGGEDLVERERLADQLLVANRVQAGGDKIGLGGGDEHHRDIRRVGVRLEAAAEFDPSRPGIITSRRTIAGGSARAVTSALPLTPVRTQ
jgi:signal peptidase II